MTTKPGKRKQRKGGSPLQRLTNGGQNVAGGRDRMQWLIVLLAFAVSVAVLTQPPAMDDEFAEYDIEAEEIARQEWQATFSFETEDLQATQRRREEAAARVPEAYIVDQERVQNRKRSLAERVEALRNERESLQAAVREALLGSTSTQSTEEVVLQAVHAYARDLRTRNPLFADFDDPSLLALWLKPKADNLPNRVFVESPDGAPAAVAELEEPEADWFELAHDQLLSNLAREGLEWVLAHGVLSPGARPAAPADAEQRRILILRDDSVAGLQRSEQKLLAETPVVNEAGDKLRERIWDLAQAAPFDPDVAIGGADTERLTAAAATMAQTELRDTLVFDPVTTESSREAARASVEPVMKTIRRLELMQDKGRPWTEQSRSDVRTFLELKRAGQEPATGMFASILANMIFCALGIGAILKAMPMVRGKKENDPTYLYVALLTLCGTLVVGRVTSFFEPTGLVVPVTAAAVLLAILTNTRLAAVTTLMAAILLSVQYGYDWRLLVVVSAMALTGVISIYKVRRRSDMAAAGAKATAVGLFTMLGIILATDSLVSDTALHNLALIGLNGFACLFIIPGLLPPMERMFGITTDIQLLEYSDLNNEVLGRLAIQVPATYSHSLMLGQLAEAAADAIGANGLLTRVAAYYHDIGKMRRPEYFIENQTGVNVHDDMSPRMSARAIASHVTEGAELARENHLPKPLIDGILEHHGTMLISFFYQQALAQQKHGDVREEDFRYPGPKPQSRETAILMICDGVESGIRSIKNPNEERVREFVDRIVAVRAEDRQFDECDLTLKELDTIKEAVTRRVLTHYHRRIEYPDKKQPGGDMPNVIPMAGGTE